MGAVSYSHCHFPRPRHPERSEESRCPARQTLRCAQGDSMYLDKENHDRLVQFFAKFGIYADVFFSEIRHSIFGKTSEQPAVYTVFCEM